MPELPEVETIRRNSEAALQGKRLDDVAVGLPKLLLGSPIPDLEMLKGHRLIGTRRRAKVLVLDFDGDLSLVVHFKLAGQFAIVQPSGDRLVAGHPVPDPAGPLPHKTTHITFMFEDGTLAYYSDVRQFGWLRLMPAEAVLPTLEAMGFGPEGTDISADNPDLLKAMARRGIPIKTLLLDQSFLAGLGNIYVDEVLFRAKIHPTVAANALSRQAHKRILAQIPPVLAEGIRQGGARIIHNKAHPVDQFPAIHGRKGEPCFVCGTAIEKIQVGGRGTYFCPKCQKVPRAKAS